MIVFFFSQSSIVFKEEGGGSSQKRGRGRNAKFWSPSYIIFIIRTEYNDYLKSHLMICITRHIACLTSPFHTSSWFSIGGVSNGARVGWKFWTTPCSLFIFRSGNHVCHLESVLNIMSYLIGSLIWFLRTHDISVARHFCYHSKGDYERYMIKIRWNCIIWHHTSHQNSHLIDNSS